MTIPQTIDVYITSGGCLGSFHRLPATRNLQGCFSLASARLFFTVDSGDTITCQTLDAGWGLDPFAEDVMRKHIPLAQRPDPANDTGHCLVGPIAVHGAQPGQVLQVDICRLVPAAVGATWVGEVQEFLPQLGVEGYFWLPWQLDVASGSGPQFLGASGSTCAVSRRAWCCTSCAWYSRHPATPRRRRQHRLQRSYGGQQPVFTDPGARRAVLVWRWPCRTG